MAQVASQDNKIANALFARKIFFRYYVERLPIFLKGICDTTKAIDVVRMEELYERFDFDVSSLACAECQLEIWVVSADSSAAGILNFLGLISESRYGGAELKEIAGFFF